MLTKTKDSPTVYTSSKCCSVPSHFLFPQVTKECVVLVPPSDLIHENSSQNSRKHSVTQESGPAKWRDTEKNKVSMVPNIIPCPEGAFLWWVNGDHHPESSLEPWCSGFPEALLCWYDWLKLIGLTVEGMINWSRYDWLPWVELNLQIQCHFLLKKI